MKNDNVKSIVVLSVICLVVAVVLAGVNFITAPIIKESQEKAVMESLKSALPDATDLSEIDLKQLDKPDCVEKVYKDEGGCGYAVTVTTSSSYSQSPMAFTVGIDTEGRIVNIELTNYKETKDFGADYPNGYIGLADEEIGNVALFSGATYSSTAFRTALSEAVGFVNTEVMD